MHLCFENGLYIAQCDYTEMLGTTPAREVAKAAGFRWNPQTKEWQTTDSYRARKLLAYASEGCRAHLAALVTEQERTKTLSRAATIDIDPPCPPGQAFRPYQKVGVVFAAERSSVIIGDDMGLGKSPEALGMLNMCPEVHTALIVCPNSVKLNWRNEAQKWLIPAFGYRIEVISTKWTLAALETFYAQSAGRYRALGIINYQILHRFCTSVEFATAGRKKVATLSFLNGLTLDQIVIDEFQNIKGDTRQAKAVMGVMAARKAGLSGTPIPNRPRELWNMLHYLDPLTWNNFFIFAIRYCGAIQGPHGWDFNGSSHEDELQDILRSKYMIRRLKSQVASEIPPKTRQVIELSANGSSKIIKAEWDAYHQAYHGHGGLLALEVAVELAKASDDEAQYRSAIATLKEGRTAAFRDMARMREETALAKLDQVLDHIRTCLEVQNKVVVYFWHRSVAARLQEALEMFHPAIITGSSGDTQRQAAVERFQTDPACRVFLGSIPAAKEGITLTAASLLLLAEMDWVPSTMQQVEGRVDRLTQTEPTLIQYLVFEHSLDATMLRTNIAKLEVIEAVLDTEHHFTVEKLDFIEGVVPEEEPTPEKSPATVALNHEEVKKVAIQLDPAEVLRIHRSLQYLAGVCDFAHAKDGQGFNLIDARIGHQLAMQETLSPQQAVLGQRIIQKYHTQLKGMAQV